MERTPSMITTCKSLSIVVETTDYGATVSKPEVIYGVDTNVASVTLRIGRDGFHGASTIGMSVEGAEELIAALQEVVAAARALS